MGYFLVYCTDQKLGALVPGRNTLTGYYCEENSRTRKRIPKLPNFREMFFVKFHAHRYGFIPLGNSNRAPRWENRKICFSTAFSEWVSEWEEKLLLNVSLVFLTSHFRNEIFFEYDRNQIIRLYMCVCSTRVSSMYIATHIRFVNLTNKVIYMYICVFILKSIDSISTKKNQ